MRINFLLDIVSDNGKPDFTAGIDFGITEFIIGLIFGAILTGSMIFLFKYLKK